MLTHTVPTSDSQQVNIELHDRPYRSLPEIPNEQIDLSRDNPTALNQSSPGPSAPPLPTSPSRRPSAGLKDRI